MLRSAAQAALSAMSRCLSGFLQGGGGGGDAKDSAGTRTADPLDSDATNAFPVEGPVDGGRDVVVLVAVELGLFIVGWGGGGCFSEALAAFFFPSTTVHPPDRGGGDSHGGEVPPWRERGGEGILAFPSTGGGGGWSGLGRLQRRGGCGR